RLQSLEACNALGVEGSVPNGTVDEGEGEWLTGARPPERVGHAQLDKCRHRLCRRLRGLLPPWLRHAAAGRRGSQSVAHERAPRPSGTPAAAVARCRPPPAWTALGTRAAPRERPGGRPNAPRSRTCRPAPR